jgi:hypothetical protein
VAFRFDSSSVKQGNVAHDRQAKTCAACFAASGTINAVKALKDALEVFGRNSDAVVFYFNNELIIIR